MLPALTEPFVVTYCLLRRFWPQLLAVVTIGIVAVNVLTLVSAKIALVEPFAGLIGLTFVVLAQLVTTVAMFEILRPALPSIRAAQDAAGDGAKRVEDRRFSAVLSVALLPFFAYYAAWGFLGDIVRQYSRLALDMAPLGQSGNVLNVIDSRWLAFAVAIAWVVRLIAKRIKRRSAFIQIVIVVCETSWVFVGLFVLSKWKEPFIAWLGSGGLWSILHGVARGIVAQAQAATQMPVEYLRRSLPETLLSLFWYIALPLVWMVLAAIIYGFDFKRHGRADDADAGRWRHRYERLPAFLRDFFGSFFAGYRNRYVPIANGVRLTFASGAILICVLIVGYRAIDWAAAWAWLLTVRAIGQQSDVAWDVLPDAISLFIGNRFQDSSLSILVEPLRIAFLAAVIETAFRLGADRTARGRQ
ncbi:hypothetical protein K0P19_32285 [Shinella sp. YE25]|nr:hypothetical protein [Shinella sp. YE25]